MAVENIYLKKALEKSGYVVIVIVRDVKTSNSRLEYVSPNAGILGINAEMLNRGLKMTIDYVHPADREKIRAILSEAIESGVTDYSHKFRLVGDDGTLYSIKSEVSIDRRENDEIATEFYMRRVADKPEVSATQHITSKQQTELAIPADLKVGDYIAESERVQVILGSYGKLSGLYSTVIDAEGKNIFPPTGPDVNMGDFYDFFQNPVNKDFYRGIWKKMEIDPEPQLLNRPEGGVGRFAVAPILLGNKLRALWVLGSYTTEETEKLEDIYTTHWDIATVMSDFLYRGYAMEIEAAKARGAGKKLRAELARQNIANEALSKIGSRSQENLGQVIEETMHDIGVHLDVDKIFLFTKKPNKPREFSLFAYYDKMGEEPHEELREILPERLHNVVGMLNDGGGRIIADKTNMTEQYKLTLMKYNFNCVMVFPIYIEKELHGLVFYVEENADRTWTREEVRFTQSMTYIFQNMIESTEGDSNMRKVNKHLLETFNSFHAGIFVRELHSGKVLFSNTSMDEMLGFDFKGNDSRRLITDLHDRFDDIDGMRKPFITKERVSNWRSYIQQLDSIMDITEIRMEWLHGEPASMIIMRKAKEL